MIIIQSDLSLFNQRGKLTYFTKLTQNSTFSKFSNKKNFETTNFGLWYKMWPLNDFLDGEFYIILKPRNVKICEHSIFFQLLNKNMFNGTLETLIARLVK